MPGTSPGMTRELCLVRPRLCSAPFRKGYTLRCVRAQVSPLHLNRGLHRQRAAADADFADRVGHADVVVLEGVPQ
jgi:hypothetical protein